MAIRRFQSAIDKIIAKIIGNKIVIGVIETYQSVYNIGDFALDDQINKRAALQLFNIGLPISVPSGSPIPFPVDMTDPTYAGITVNCIIQVEQLNDVFASATASFPIYDVKVVKTYTDSSRTALSTLSIYGHSSGGGSPVTIDELQIILR